MLKMAHIQYIKDLYENEEKSLREIARETGHHFSTVKKYAQEEDWNKDQLPGIQPESYPVLGGYIPVIDEWMEEDQRAPRKQRHTSTRIYDRLVEEQKYAGSYSSVRRYVRRKRILMRQKVNEGSLPISQPQGHAQVDFGKFHYHNDAGKDKEAYALTVTFPYSNHGLTQVFPSENQECLLEGLKRVFEHIGGVPLVLRMDNMTTAVAHIGQGAQRELAEGFSRFMLHYRFQPVFCNPASGNEKGNVENKVGYSRRNFFVPVPTITDFEQFNEKLWASCEKDSQRVHYARQVPMCELWEEEKQKLLYLPPNEYSVFRYETVKLNKYGSATIDTNTYGLSPELAGQTAQARIYFDKVALYYEHALLKTYPRSYERNKEVLDWTQYVGALCKKPGAVEHTRFFDQLPKLWQAHLQAAQGKERKSALLLLREIVSDGNAPLCDETIALASECGRTDPDSLRQCYYMISRKEYHPRPLTLGDVTPPLHYTPNLCAYDMLSGGAPHA